MMRINETINETIKVIKLAVTCSLICISASGCNNAESDVTTSTPPPVSKAFAEPIFKFADQQNIAIPTGVNNIVYDPNPQFTIGKYTYDQTTGLVKYSIENSNGQAMPFIPSLSSAYSFNYGYLTESGYFTDRIDAGTDPKPVFWLTNDAGSTINTAKFNLELNKTNAKAMNYVLKDISGLNSADLLAQLNNNGLVPTPTTKDGLTITIDFGTTMPVGAKAMYLTNIPATSAWLNNVYKTEYTSIEAWANALNTLFMTVNESSGTAFTSTFETEQIGNSLITKFSINGIVINAAFKLNGNVYAGKYIAKSEGFPDEKLWGFNKTAMDTLVRYIHPPITIDEIKLHDRDAGIYFQNLYLCQPALTKSLLDTSTLPCPQTTNTDPDFNCFGNSIFC